jgi:hypothetical protein
MCHFKFKSEWLFEQHHFQMGGTTSMDTIRPS